jgi:hypothetical protein
MTVPKPLQDKKSLSFVPTTGELVLCDPSEVDRDAIIVDAITEPGFFATPDPAVESPLRAETVMA